MTNHTTGSDDNNSKPTVVRINFEHIPIEIGSPRRAAFVHFRIGADVKNSARCLIGGYTLTVYDGSIEFLLSDLKEAEVRLISSPGSEPVLLTPTDTPVVLTTGATLAATGTIDALFSQSDNTDTSNLYGFNYYDPDDITVKGGCGGACW
ncbi:MAG TPA: hypothetical protein VEW66_02875 [Thermomicrobiales bacterium]|nr:hypothetical protein [Thermomicrobiales bacterium]